jgi:hypothetical protein
VSNLWNSTKSRIGSSPKLSIGDVYTFKTNSYWEFALPQTDRYGAFKVIGFKEEFAVVVVLDFVSVGRPPTKSELESTNVLVAHRFANASTPRPCVYHVYLNSIEDSLSELVLVTNVRPTLSELDLPKKYESYGSASTINYAVEGEWRWANDRNQFEKEYLLHNEEQEKKRTQESIRLQTRLKSLNWEKLREEAHFSHWELPPPEFTSKARQLIWNSVDQLKALPSKPRKREVRNILKATMFALNELNLAFGDVIETEEREDIMMVIEELAFVAKQRALMPELDELRDW